MHSLFSKHAQKRTIQVLGFYMNVRAFRKIVIALWVLTLTIFVLTYIHNERMKSQVIESADYYLNNSIIESLNLQISKELINLIERERYEDAKVFLNNHISRQSKHIRDRIGDGKHTREQVKFMEKSLNYIPNDESRPNLNKPLN